LRERFYYVYMLMSSSRRALYIGITDSLLRHIWEHKCGDTAGFTARYDCNRLVYFERYRYVKNPIAREKQLKGWRRSKKLARIASMNPSFRDLAADWYATQGPSTRAFALAQDDKPK
jgi:putative endonuclease